MKIVNVIPLKKGVLKDDLTYFTSKKIENGSIAVISLRNKKTLGLVVSTEDVSGAKINIKDMGFNLKKIIEVKEKSVFLKEYLDSAILMSRYFASGKSSAIASLIPAVFREEYDKISTNLTLALPLSRGGLGEVKAEKLLLQEPLTNRISIYKTLIRENFAMNKSVFVVLPTETDIETFAEHLSKGIEQFTFVVSGGLSSKKMIEKFRQITTTSHTVLILGTAPFLSIPRPDLGVIITEHASSPGYKMLARPHFDLRVFAEVFAAKINARFILADSLLGFETIAKEAGKDGGVYFPMHPLAFRIGFSGEIEIENPKKLANDAAAKFKIFTEKSIREIKNAIAGGKSVFIFALRKGLATQTVCRDCGEVVSCDKCQAPMILRKSRVFVCNRCGEEKDGETACANCHSWNMMPLGIGTDTVTAELGLALPQVKIFKLDKESAKTKKAAEKIIREFEDNPGSIMVGTEMAIFYLKKKVALSIIASFETLWSIPNYKMSEKILQLAISILSATEEKFIIQTKNSEDPAILAIASRNLLSFVRSELEDRKSMGYPPFKRFIKIKHLGNKAETLKAKQLLAGVFKDYSPLIFSGFIERLKGKYVINALIKLDPENWSLPELSLNSSIDENLLAKLLALPPAFEISVDPEDLL